MSTKAPERPRAAAPIDPRIHARRVEVERTRGRRRLRRLVVLGAVVAIVGGMWWVTLSPLLDVDHIRIDGADRTGESTVLDALEIGTGDALLTADVGAAADAVAALPWVATADVRRSWPGTVEVHVVEREPVAAVAATGGGWVLVDRSGLQLAVELEPAIELVRVAGHAVAPELAATIAEQHRAAVAIAASLPPSLRPAVAALWPQRDGTVEATVRLTTGAEAVARLGGTEQLEAKLVALAAVLERAELAGVRVIDLRVPGAPALTRG